MHISHVSSANATGVEAYGNVIQARMAPLIAAANTTIHRAGMGGPNIGSSSTWHGTASGGLRGSVREPVAPPHAVWLSACLTHGLAQTAHWTVAEINGVREWEAFQRWFNGSMDAERRDWIDCTTYKCEHTCP